MSTTNFIDGVTPITGSWLNDVNALVYGQSPPPSTPIKVAGGVTAGTLQIDATSRVAIGGAPGTVAPFTIVGAAGAVNQSFESTSNNPAGGTRILLVGAGTRTDTLKVRVSGFTESNWTDSTSCPTYLMFSTTPSGSTTAIERVRVDSTGNLLITSSAGGSVGVGTGFGAGGTVTQLTNKNTGVTLNKVSGSITMNNQALAGSTSTGFTFTNSCILAGDIIICNIKSGATGDSYQVTVDAVAAGSCRISLRNLSGGPLSEAVVIGFVVIKGSTT
jgi:hypothetical protein